MNSTRGAEVRGGGLRGLQLVAWLRGGASSVLVGVGGFVLEHLDELVKPGGEDGSEDWADPVD